MFKIDNNASQIIYTANTESAMDEKIIRKDQINIIERENGILKIIKFSEMLKETIQVLTEHILVKVYASSNLMMKK